MFGCLDCRRGHKKHHIGHQGIYTLGGGGLLGVENEIPDRGLAECVALKSIP